MLNNEQRKSIRDKREEYLGQLPLKRARPLDLKPWLPVLQTVNEKKIPFDIEYIFCTSETSVQQDWITSLQKPPLEDFAFAPSHIKQRETHYVHAQMHQQYPTLSGKGYRPALTYGIEFAETPATDILNDAIRSLQMENQVVYFFYNDHNPVLKLEVRDIALHAADLLQPAGDVCLLTTDYSRLIVRTGNNEWLWGRHYNYENLYRTDLPRLYVYWATGTTGVMRKIFSEAAPAMSALFHEDELDLAEEAFHGSGAHTAIHYIIGKELWIQVLFEKHEGYYCWHCYTWDRGLVENWRAFFKRLDQQARKT